MNGRRGPRAPYKPVEERRSQQVTAQLTPEQYEQVKSAAFDQNVTVSAFVRDAILQALKPTKKGTKS
jgi:uncharacterized protein (DUF1778 family)